MSRTPSDLDGRENNMEPLVEEEEEAEPEHDREDEDHGDSGTTPLCPSCMRAFNIALLLPCSHTLCGRCVAGGENICHGPRGATGSAHQRASPSTCEVLCPCCHHSVDLPCWDWASATCCLPPNPTLTPGWIARRARYQMEGGKILSLQGVPLSKDIMDITDSSTDIYGSPLESAIDLQEEEMEQSISGLKFSLKPSTTAPSLHLSTSCLTVTFRGPSPQPPQVTESLMRPESYKPLPQLCGDVVIVRGQFYWEVDVSNSMHYRIGVSSLDRASGWWLERHGLSFSALYDSRREPLHAVPPHIKTLGVFLNIGGGVLSFYNTLTQEHLATLPTRFSPTGVCPALGLGQGRLRFHCGLPPPPHVFLSRTSTYRGPSGAGGGRWHRDVPFQSVRTVIQKFEELTVSDSDSGLVSSFGSSCSTLASLPEPGISCQLSRGTALHPRREKQEAGEDSMTAMGCHSANLHHKTQSQIANQLLQSGCDTV
ncbi:hypothetical protein UPYG_G00202430 [Umbra pygmaea]|uniref:SPRY domain-containing protein n=1 Tax=Umbra pygmaea TaxID=75934 RepID=A0ABD0WII4_UMBPY